MLTDRRLGYEPRNADITRLPRYKAQYAIDEYVRSQYMVGLDRGLEIAERICSWLTCDKERNIKTGKFRRIPFEEVRQWGITAIANERSRASEGK
jgi:hypothetical protein